MCRDQSRVADLTVVVPSYNHSRFIERTLRSIFVQSILPRKLIVIDDGSSDESVTTIERALKDCEFETELIARENRGLSKTLNEGFGLCNTEYFAYLGSDDIWLAEFIEKNIAILDQNKDACLVFGHSFVIDDDDYVLDRTDNWFRFDPESILCSLLEGKVFSSPTVVYRASMLGEGPWNETSESEDYELYLKLCRKYSFALNSEPLSAWRQHETNTSRDLPKIFREMVRAQKEALNCLDLKPSDRRKYRGSLLTEGAINYARYGFKKEALSILLSGASIPFSRKLEIVKRLLMPSSIVSWNRSRKHSKARRNFGKLIDG